MLGSVDGFGGATRVSSALWGQLRPRDRRPRTLRSVFTGVPRFVEVNDSVSGQPAVKAVIKHVRNAVSHPRMKETEPPTTGSTTVEDGTGCVSRLRFTDSPDLTSKGSLRTGGDVDEAQVFSIELPLTVLTAWAKEIAMTLAQPVMNNWDSPKLVALSL